MANHDYILENAHGRSVRTDFNNALAALVTNNSGTIEPPTLYKGMLWNDVTVPPNGKMRQRNQANGGWNPMSGVPGEASNADVITGTDDSMFVTPAAAKNRADSIVGTRRRNRLVNPDFRISQENGDTAFTLGYPANAYIADQWWVTSNVSGVTFNLQHFNSITPQGSPCRVRVTANAAKAVLAAGDQTGILQSIEGINVADLSWGTSFAKPVVVRIGFRGPAGTYTISLKNGANNRCYLKPFTITAAQAYTDVALSFAIPGDTTGTWPFDNTCAMFFCIMFAAGSNYTAAPNTWQAGGYYGAAGMATSVAAGATFDIFDCGLYIDESGMGTLPRWELIEQSEELVLCQRYFCPLSTVFSGNVTSGGTYYSNLALLPCDMRTTPTIALSGGAVLQSNFPASNSFLAGWSPGGLRSIRESRVANGTGAGYFTCNRFVVSARM